MATLKGTKQSKTVCYYKNPDLKPKQQKVQIVKWHAVAIWRYKVGREYCSICRLPMDDLCLDCAKRYNHLAFRRRIPKRYAYAVYGYLRFYQNKDQNKVCAYYDCYETCNAVDLESIPRDIINICGEFLYEGSSDKRMEYEYEHDANYWLVAEKCNTSWGVCCHQFHTHCILKWLQIRNTCPMDNKEWKEQQFEVF